jgi:putative transposase
VSGLTGSTPIGYSFVQPDIQSTEVVSRDLVPFRVLNINSGRVSKRDELPVSWTAKSWKIPVLQPGPETERPIKKSKFTEAQIAFILKQAEEGTPLAEVCRKAGTSDAAFFGWRKKYAGQVPSEPRRLRCWRRRSGKLEKLVPDLSLDKAML